MSVHILHLFYELRDIIMWYRLPMHQCGRRRFSYLFQKLEGFGDRDSLLGNCVQKVMIGQNYFMSLLKSKSEKLAKVSANVHETVMLRVIEVSCIYRMFVKLNAFTGQVGGSSAISLTIYSENRFGVLCVLSVPCEFCGNQCVMIS